jgi:hypothetical protein
MVRCQLSIILSLSYNSNFLISSTNGVFCLDLFAFIIKMPAMHRLSVFRDDFVFLVYMYQRYIYRIDETRPVEK